MSPYKPKETIQTNNLAVVCSVTDPRSLWTTNEKQSQLIRKENPLMVDPNDQPLFPAPTTTTPDTTPTEAPLCSLCRLRPAKWGPRMNDWTRYCGSGHCSNHLRK